MSVTRDPDAAPARQRRRVIVGAAVLLLAAIVSGMALSRGGDDDPTAELAVGWGGSEGHPSCVYDPEAQSVDAKITIEGNAPRPHRVTVTVTAYADENTSKPVGSSSRSVPVDGDVNIPLLITFPVEKAPHVDVDGETACSLSVD
ncbi:MAG TPA: hypothetical protein VLI04_14610 [Nocardioidaceae bacterium]|nr:hypothetical protein [Nocardioidaceae bacterium]